MKVIFLAGPYRGATVYDITRNIERARRYSAALWLEGYAVLCPHMNTALFDGLHDDEVWLASGREFLSRCDGVFVMPGSETSSGVRREVVHAIERNIPIINLNMDFNQWERIVTHVGERQYVCRHQLEVW